MTFPPEKYNALKEKIIECVPEIMELKDGCIIEDEYGNKYSFIRREKSTSVEHEKYWIAAYDTKARLVRHGLEEEELKILGRSIQLADVLRACGESKIICGLSVTHEGNIMLYAHLGEWDVTDIIWNLAKPLHEQEDSVLEFLYKLICND